MGLRLGYALRETLHNLRRNLLLTTASMLTVAISLGLVGSAMLLRYGVDNTTQKWRGGIEFEVFLNPDVTPEQTDLVGRQLTESPDVAEVHYVSQEEQYELFQVLFAEEPAYLENVTAENLPPSFRVEPSVEDADVIRALGDQMEQQPGVRTVEFAEEAVRNLLRVSTIAQRVIFGIAAVLLFAASLLIFNTIRMAIFARRREIEVMKLVGATNSFIRVPFMIEGMLQGLVGAAVAFGVVYVLQRPAQEFVRNVPLFDNFVVLGSQVTTTGILCLVVGGVIGAVGAGVAVSRFLDV